MVYKHENAQPRIYPLETPDNAKSLRYRVVSTSRSLGLVISIRRLGSTLVIC